MPKNSFWERSPQFPTVCPQKEQCVVLCEKRAQKMFTRSYRQPCHLDQPLSGSDRRTRWQLDRQHHQLFFLSCKQCAPVVVLVSPFTSEFTLHPMSNRQIDNVKCQSLVHRPAPRERFWSQNSTFSVHMRRRNEVGTRFH